jgi:uncharacterized membrane protein (DUF106 family)
MKATKLIFATVIALLAVCVLASVVSAQTTPAFDVSVASSNHGVKETSTYTLTVTNTGTVNIVSANITVPGLYANVVNTATSTQGWTASYTGGVISLATSGTGIANGQSVTVTFQAQNPVTAATYSWSTIALSSDGGALTKGTDTAIAIVSIVPMMEIFLIAAIIAFVNTGINRVLINYFIGWEQYRVMQKEMAEHRTETMAAARSGDQKRMEKLKKKQSQINAMQAKMMKPQMLQIGISFLYIIVWWVVLIPTFGNTSLAYLPGATFLGPLGALPVVYLYPVLSFFLALLSQRIIGVNPIEM